jgi:hypothetical protein
MDKMRNTIYDALNDENKEKSKSFTTEWKDIIVMDALDKGILEFHIGR